MVSRIFGYLSWYDMSSVCPGLAAEALSNTAVRLFCGRLPELGIERRILSNSCQLVYPWFASLKRVKEQANEFVEIDVSGVDAELILRYNHVFFARRAFHTEAIVKLLSALETGKPPKDAQPDVLSCLADCNLDVAPRLAFEEKKLLHAKRISNGPLRRELQRQSPLDAWDVLPMMRCVEDDDVSKDVGPGAEFSARAYLSVPRCEAAVEELASLLLPSSPKRTFASVDKRETRLFGKVVPRDYDKVGYVAKLRPLDLTAMARFFGERFAAAEQPAASGSGGNAAAPPPSHVVFQRHLWGNMFRCFTQHPSFLRYSSVYAGSMLQCGVSGGGHGSIASTSPFQTAAAAGIDHSSMSVALAKAVTAQQRMLPAHRFRLQHRFVSVDGARQYWSVEPCVAPIGRLLPLIGQGVAEDLLASVLVDAFWAPIHATPDVNALDDRVIRECQGFVKDMVALRETGHEKVLHKVRDAFKLVVSPLTEAESAWTPPPEAVHVDAAPLESTDDDEAMDEGESAEGSTAISGERSSA